MPKNAGEARGATKEVATHELKDALHKQNQRSNSSPLGDGEGARISQRCSPYKARAAVPSSAAAFTSDDGAQKALRAVPGLVVER